MTAKTADQPSGGAWDGQAADAESREWVRALSGAASERRQAVERLYALLLRAARSELERRALAGRDFGDLDRLAAEAADDALTAVRSELHTYRGQSRFMTWAYKYVLVEAAVRARRRTWEGRTLPPEADGWARLASSDRASVRSAIGDGLTPHQRAVFVAIALSDVPIDVVAERRGTTRGALYKTLRDARLRLRAQLAKAGLVPSSLP